MGCTMVKNHVLEGYNDANLISDSKNSKSTSGYVFTLGGAAIYWKSSKQTVLARSTIESEFIALDKQLKKQNGFVTFWKIFQCGSNQSQLYAYIAIVRGL